MAEKNNQQNLKETCYLDLIIEKGIAFLLIFTPLAIGTVQPWSISIMEIAAFTILGVSLLKMAGDGKAALPKLPLTLLIAGLMLLVLFQIVPLPGRVLASISPSAENLFKTLTDNGDIPWKTISLHPHVTREDFFKLLSYAAVFFVIINQCRTREQVSRITRIIISLGCIIAVFAIIQRITWNGKLFWFYPVRERLIHSGIWGPYLNHNHFAGYMEMAIPLGLGLLLYRITQIKGLSSSLPLREKFVCIANSNNLASIVFIFLSVLVMAGALFYSLSRGGITGFSASLIFLGWLISTRRSMKWLTRPIMVFGCILFLIVILGSWGRIQGRFEKVLETEKIARFDLWPDAIGIAADFPLFGAGLGTFNDVFPKYQTTHHKLIFEHAENDYLEILTDMGITGLTLSIVLFTAFFYISLKVWRSRRSNFVKCMAAGGLSSLIAILVHGFSDFNFRIPANALLLTIIAAIVYSLLFNISSKNNTYKGMEFKLNGWQYSVGIIAILAITSFLLSFPIKTLIGEYHYKKAALHLDDPSTPYKDVYAVSKETIVNYNNAIISLKSAISAKPSESIYNAELGRIYSKLGKWAKTLRILKAPLPKGAIQKDEAYNKAIEYYKKSILLNPTKARYHFALGQTNEAAGGDAHLTKKELSRALMLAPSDIFLRLAVALFYLNTGRAGDSLEQAEYLSKIDTSYLPPSSGREQFKAGILTTGHAKRIYNSFLFQALEIAWRVSRDPEVVKGIAPDSPEAEIAVTLFLESKGL